MKTQGAHGLLATVAEELLEIVMRRYERASTLLTSNTLWKGGQAAGDSAAVATTLARLLNHGYVLQCGPRSRRTKTQLPGPESMN